jgi:hypothetical protein
MTQKFKNPAYQKIHEQLCKDYKEIVGTNFEEDYEHYQKNKEV